ncbi:deoxyuridine 5'-triphosphate nucleotidohydrolase [Cryptococcus deuterogattii LA55]|nr:deoxyuridine 5'-triphosphate nucleotidohydrolase [Cryptococcus deuterogattii LA55]KIR31352.1 deoxyuridine 5'-triphosphate nucleotidohydrolase [Cryptococcus deuterogattii MMRL2647]KIR92133.1 deoxyuridine 5'-triphosphate nucleotidohydrolase [Cryptococcus deuterogattii CBS 10090]KIR96113.1 deoxyuridine 5'-triphosphate nucleotidohydrolase [Cryptococcus deuterogattii 2001/935-1]
MSRFVRPSKYRHVYGSKSKVNYENVKISGSAWDTDLVAAGGKYLSVNWQASGGGFPTKLPDIVPLARGHTAPVLDTAWNPFDDNIVASAGEDGKVFIWKVEESAFEGWGEDNWEPQDFSPALKLSAGGRKVGQVIFHPTSSNLLTAASGDHLVRLWDISSGADEPKIVLKGHGDSIQSIAWNSVGTTLATFSRMSDRQVSLWDTSSLKNLDTQSIDSSAGVLMPFYAEGNDILFLAGKGDGNIRYYEFEGDQLHFLNEYKTSDPQRGMTLLPRRALDTQEHEIARVYKLSGGCVEPLSFIVPRKSESFQSDIFPPANSVEPAQTAADWFAGKNVRPNVVDLETGGVSASKETVPTPTSSAPAPAPAQVSAPSSTPSPAPAPVKEEPKEEPKPAPISTPSPGAIPTPAPAPAAADVPVAVKKEIDTVSEVTAKGLEIEQPEEPSDDEQEDKGPLEKVQDSLKSLTVGREEPTKESNGVTAPSNTLLVKKLSSSATIPTRGSPLSAGYDLYSAEETVVPARGKALIDSGLSIAVPEGTYGRVAPRSGLASKHSIDTGAGVIDADYRGPVKVLLFNYSDADFTSTIVMAPILEVEDLDVTARGSGGFGSTGGFGKAVKDVAGSLI